jgi:ABC-2 type transport system ATP-binding protein
MSKKVSTDPAEAKDVAISVRGLSKSFRLPTESSQSIKQVFVNWTRGVKGYKKQEVLRDISFDVEKGDFFGIVGRNGSGKSTLLKLISGIYTPDAGSIKINGSLVSFIELGVGFNPELTGRENVFLNGALMGFSTEEVEKMYAEIVSFAELEDFMDQKLKNYSSGMQVRLAFSCAIRAKSDILVLDELLAVGDENFQRKCYKYFAEAKKTKKTIVLVTHSMDQVQQFCNKAMLIDKGHKTEIGKPADIAQIYRELNDDSANKNVSETDNRNFHVDCDFENKGDKLIFDVNIKPKVKVDDPVVTFVIYRDDGEWVYRWTSDEKIKQKISLIKPRKLHIELENIFPNGLFNVQFAIKSRDRSIEYATFNELSSFEITNSGSHSGDIYWKPKEKAEYE